MLTKEELREQSESDTATPVKAIREYCLYCCMYSSHEVTMCPSKDCRLWAFRFGRNPYANRKAPRNAFKKGHNTHSTTVHKAVPEDASPSEYPSTTEEEVIDITGLLVGDSDIGEEI